MKNTFSCFSSLIRQTNESEFFIFANNFIQIRENSAYLHCLKEGGKVVSKVKKTLSLLESIKSIICKISTNYCPLSKVFCLPHYYRKDVIPPTGVYKQFFILNKMFCVWKRGGGHPVISNASLFWIRLSKLIACAISDRSIDWTQLLPNTCRFVYFCTLF